MSLYQTYRPQQFGNLMGQAAAARVLQQALRLNRVAHAYMFTGPRGTGKTTSARIFARALNCEKPLIADTSYEPCDACDACLSILQNRATDLIEIDAASNRGIEDIRSLREQVQYPPVALKRKVYIIDEVHMLTGEAFNALLKTLEEPPSHCLFILATTELHKVPVTIRSRCQTIRFERGSLEALTKKLDYIVKKEKWDVEKGVTELIAGHADGAFRDAETLLEHLSTQHQPLTIAAVSETLGVAEDALLSGLLTASFANNVTEVRALLVTLRDQSSRPDQVVTQLIERVRTNLLKLDTKKSPRVIEPYVYALEQLLEAYILGKSSPLPLLPLEIACLNIAQYTSGRQEHAIIPDPEPIASVIAAPVLKPVHVVVAAAPVPAPPASAAVPVVEIRDAKMTDVRKAWKTATDEIARTNLPLGQMLRDSTFHSTEGSTINILVRYKFHAEKLNEKKNRMQVEALMEELTTKKWDVSVALGENLPKRESKKELRAETDHAVHSAADVFGAS